MISVSFSITFTVNSVYQILIEYNRLCFCSSHFLEKISPQSQVPVTGYRIYVGGVDVAYTLGVLGHPRDRNRTSSIYQVFLDWML